MTQVWKTSPWVCVRLTRILKSLWVYNTLLTVNYFPSSLSLVFSIFSHHLARAHVSMTTSVNFTFGSISLTHPTNPQNLCRYFFFLSLFFTQLQAAIAYFSRSYFILPTTFEFCKIQYLSTLSFLPIYILMFFSFSFSILGSFIPIALVRRRLFSDAIIQHCSVSYNHRQKVDTWQWRVENVLRLLNLMAIMWGVNRVHWTQLANLTR